MTELLLSRQGPLAHVWLASNYDKKLSKQQFLNTNIVASSNLLSNQHIQPSRGTADGETITLRLSGQLLLGIVRIYSRKTKYLLDDINDTLHKLKNSFKYASGATLGSGSSVNLPPQQTTLKNMSRLLLQDQVTDHDLFYQEDLDLEGVETSDPGALFSQVSSVNIEESADIDRSVEYPRRASAQQDDGLDLDLDLDMDYSIEQGRDAQVAMPEGDQSLLDINGKEGETSALDFDLGQPLETIEERQQAVSQEQAAQQTRQRPRGTLVRVTEEGVIRTAKRKIIVDSQETLERGIPNEVLQNLQDLQTHGRFTEDFLSVKLTERQKLELIEELATPVSSKRRKIWNLDDQLRQRCLELAQEERQQPDETNETIDFDYDADLDFDLSLPGLDSDRPEEAPEVNMDEVDEPDSGVENVKGTSQIAELLRETFYEKPTSTLEELMEKDTAIKEGTPLGIVQKNASTTKVNQRREATRCFFELLVLAGQDCVSLEQDVEQDGILIGKGITIRPRDNLVSRFV